MTMIKKFIINPIKMSQYKIHWHVQTIHELRHRKPPQHTHHWIERIMMLAIMLLKMLFPSFWIRHYFDLKWYEERNKAMEVYVIGKTILLFCCGALWRWSNWRVVALFVYGFLDLFTYLIGTIVLADVYNRTPNLIRNLLLCGFNLMEIVSTFAMLYLFTQSVSVAWHPIVSRITWFYFSMVAFTTVWFGDVAPNNLLWQVLVVCELFCSLIFLSLVLSSTASRLNIKGE